MLRGAHTQHQRLRGQGWWETSEFQTKPDADREMPAAPSLRGRAVRADSVPTLSPEMVGPAVCCFRAPSTETENEEETGTAPGRPENVIAFPIRRWGSCPRDVALRRGGKGPQLSSSFQGTFKFYTCIFSRQFSRPFQQKRRCFSHARYSVAIRSSFLPVSEVLSLRGTSGGGRRPPPYYSQSGVLITLSG